MVKIEFEPFRKGHCFPLTKEEIEQAISALPSADVRGIERIVVRCPKKNAEYNMFGKYDEIKRTIYLFAQFRTNDGKYLLGKIAMPETEYRLKILLDTIPHEVGHHVGIWAHNDHSEDFAEQYAKHKKE